MLISKNLTFLLAIFIFALFLRFIYYPKDIYFGIDQATGSFAVQEILNGHPKLIGPSTSFPGLRHGVLYYYLYAPFYKIGNGNPAFAAAFLRVVNALGIFLMFAIGVVLFNEFVGIIAALLFAVSFEQTQFALYFNHPSLSVIGILVMFLGLSSLIFKKKKSGLIIALFGLGLSIQFEFLLTYLIMPFILIVFTFKKSLTNLDIKTIISGLLIFLLTIFTFIVAEIKFNFRSISFLPRLLFNDSHKSIYRIISTYVFELGQVIKFSLTGYSNLNLVIGMILLTIFIITILYFSKVRNRIIFLGIWFFSVIVTYIVTGGDDLKVDILQYHQNAGVSCSLILFVSYILYILGKKSKYLAILIIIMITFANFYQIEKLNPYGSIPQINAQSFMLLSDEKQVLDFIYKDASGAPFAVKGVTLPFYINTTWSYLFEWYGKQTYGYLPIWGGKNAVGYAGNLVVEEAQSKLPDKRYLIIEPLRGIPNYLVDNYLKEENYFTTIVEEKKIGAFIVQKRVKI